MKITLISIGSIKKPYIKDGIQEYLKRIKRYSPLETVEIKEETYSSKLPKAELLKREGERILKKLKGGDYVVALWEKGKPLSSEGLSKLLKEQMDSGRKGMAFIIGGPYGLHEDVIKKADLALSLSEMTFPHDLARLMLSEQVYRAFTILKGEPYSH